MKVVGIALSAAVTLSVCGCGVSGAAIPEDDGVYTGVSSEDDKGAYGEVSVTVEDGAITACSFVTWQKDGSVKDAEYGKVNGEIANQEFYDKAQLAVRAMRQYADALAEVQSPEEVDAITGATIAHGQFLEAVADAFDGEK
jgi:major membrane immunogen (membrane-anchored lipoprotein)